MAEWIIPVAVTIALAVIAASATAVKVAWNLRDWLATEFSATRKSFHDEMDKHESLDQERHEDNLERFGNIKASLASAGIKNGTPGK